MPTISFKAEGRFGNNLIQYCIAKLLSKLFGHTLVSRQERGASLITDFEWTLLAPFLVENLHTPHRLRKHPYAKKHLRLEGFFQDSTYLIPFRQVLLSFFTPTTTDFINETVTVSQLVHHIQQAPRRDEIVVHLRLDDFRTAGKDRSSLILHPDYFHRLLPALIQSQSLPIRIVYQRKQHLAEEAYIATFARYTPTLQSSDLLDDFASLVNAKVLVSSNSTFSWMAAFLAPSQIRILPTIHHMGTQNLGPIDSTDVVKESFFLTL
jgi:hypothetical protein